MGFIEVSERTGTNIQEAFIPERNEWEEMRKRGDVCM
jgi:hypothetical protein